MAAAHRYQVFPDLEQQIGVSSSHMLTDAGYHGHNAPPSYHFKVFTSGQRRRVIAKIKREAGGFVASSASSQPDQQLQIRSELNSPSTGDFLTIIDWRRASIERSA